jgi:hypothetical protein
MLTDSISATPIANNGLKQGFEVLNKTSQDINQSLVKPSASLQSSGTSQPNKTPSLESSLVNLSTNETWIWKGF